jgi:hypothetical protein
MDNPSPLTRVGSHPRTVGPIAGGPYDARALEKALFS